MVELFAWWLLSEMYIFQQLIKPSESLADPNVYTNTLKPGGARARGMEADITAAPSRPVQDQRRSSLEGPPQLLQPGAASSTGYWDFGTFLRSLSNVLKDFGHKAVAGISICQVGCWSGRYYNNDNCHGNGTF